MNLEKRGREKAIKECLTALCDKRLYCRTQKLTGFSFGWRMASLHLFVLVYRFGL